MGIIAPLFPYPFIFLICMLFRRSYWRKSHAATVQQHVEEKIEENKITKARETFDYSYVKHGAKIIHGRIIAVKQFVYPEYLHRLNPSVYSLDIKFPWWFIGIGWFLWVVTFVGSVLFVIYFAIHFDDYTIRRWISSVVISILSSIFVTQPVKVQLCKTWWKFFKNCVFF